MLQCELPSITLQRRLETFEINIAVLIFVETVLIKFAFWLRYYVCVRVCVCLCFVLMLVFDIYLYCK